jgi:hypothetical protein
MPNPQERFQGLFIPYVTPFDDSGALDIESLERLTAHFVSSMASPDWSPARASAKDLYSPYKRNAAFMRAPEK